MLQTKNLWIIHLVGWLLFIMLPITVMSRESVTIFESKLLTSGYFWLFIGLYVAIFYANFLYLIPAFYIKQRYTFYLAFFLAGFLVIYNAQPFENLIFQKFQRREIGAPEPRFGPPPEMEFRAFAPPPRLQNSHRPAVDFVSLVLFVVVWVIALAARISEQWRLSEKKIILSEADKAQAELSFFKAQINPHFLFNTLNNIYALAVNQSENTAPSIMKLSAMMRYITEEATENFVPLEEEIACLENYIDLQKLRLNAKTTVGFDTSRADGHIQIAPLILMTFVENAFKYGISNHYESHIDISIAVIGKDILFFCTNKIFDSRDNPERTGVGISNTKKRLEFLYPGLHDLQVKNDGNIFSVYLKLLSA